MISKALFEQIPDDDWRKETWIAPEDAGKAPGTKYHTLFTDENFKKVPAYVHLKFKLKEGNMIDSTPSKRKAAPFTNRTLFSEFHASTPFGTSSSKE